VGDVCVSTCFACCGVSSALQVSLLERLPTMGLLTLHAHFLTRCLCSNVCMLFLNTWSQKTRRCCPHALVVSVFLAFYTLVSFVTLTHQLTITCWCVLVYSH
jgi:hypothetical protein